MTLPLTGLRIIAIEHWGAGPYGSGHLADLGADVIKIENRQRGGDASRGAGPHFLGEHDSHFFQAFNRNKRSLSLELKQDDGQTVLHRLAATADALLHNLRGDQSGKLGLTYADLSPYNPKLVCAHISAYGRDGERGAWPGFDYLMQAEAGFYSLTGEPDGPPARFGLSMVDFMTGATTSTAVLAGILGARETGLGRDIDVTLYDVAMHQLTYPGVWYLNEEFVTDRVARSGHPYAVPSQLYRTADGWILIMCQSQHFWETFCDLLERPDLKQDARFDGPQDRYENRDALTPLLDAQLGRHPTADWIALFGGQIPLRARERYRPGPRQSLLPCARRRPGGAPPGTARLQAHRQSHSPGRTPAQPPRPATRRRHRRHPDRTRLPRLRNRRPPQLRHRLS